MKMVKASKWFIRGIIFLLFIYLLLTAFNWQDFLSTGARFINEPFIIMLIFLGYLGSFLLKAIAWKLYFRRKITITSSLYGIFYSLLINHLLPFKVGDFVRAMVLNSREQEVTLEQSFHSVFILRVMDIVSLCVLAGIGGIYYQTILSFPTYLFLVVLLFGMMAIFVIKMKYPIFFERNLQLFLQAFARLNGLLLFFLVFCSWVLEGAVLFGVAMIVMEPLTPFEAVWANSITIIGQVFQFTPGGITTYETVMTYALSFLHISSTEGIMIAIYSHALKFLFSYIVGIYVYIRYPITINTLRKWLNLKGVKTKHNEKRI